jgi:hypothetical protein
MNRGNGKSPINGGLIGKSSITGGCSLAALDSSRATGIHAELVGPHQMGCNPRKDDIDPIAQTYTLNFDADQEELASENRCQRISLYKYACCVK